MWTTIAVYFGKKAARNKGVQKIALSMAALALIPITVLFLIIAALTGVTASGGQANSCEPATGGAGQVAPAPSGSKVWPMKEGTFTLTSGFGPRDGTLHRGQDLAGANDTPIYAALDGNVVASDGSDPTGFGWWIVIDSKLGGQSLSTVYGHMYQNSVKVKAGDTVRAGQQIAGVGSNGGSTGPHLHFEVWPGGRLTGGQAIDPGPWLKDAIQPGAPPAAGAPSPVANESPASASAAPSTQPSTPSVAASAPAASSPEPDSDIDAGDDENAGSPGEEIQDENTADDEILDDPAATDPDSEDGGDDASAASAYDGDSNVAPDEQTANDCGFGSAGGGLKPGSVPPELEPWIRKAGSLCPQIKPSLLAAQMGAESGFRRGQTSVTGAQGLTQFQPETWPSYGRDDDGNGRISPWDDGDAIMAQGRFMCEIAGTVDQAIASGKVKGEAVGLYLAAYNAGPGAVLSAGGMPSGGDYSIQTQPYVAKILAAEPQYRSAVTGELTNAIGTGKGAAVVAAARTGLGQPYVWGGGNTAGPSGGGYDCSGLTSFAVFRGAGITLPRTSEMQWGVGSEVPMNQAQPGDLVFGSWAGSGPGHVGVYIGNGRMVHAPTFGEVVKEGPVQQDMRARRVF